MDLGNDGEAMKDTPPHLQTLEEVERSSIPGLLEVLREEGIDGVRYALWDATGWHRDYSPPVWRNQATDEQGATCAEFLLRAARYFADHGITQIERVMTDNHWRYSKSLEMASAIQTLIVKHVFIRPYRPWQNAKVERYNRTLQTEWAYWQVFTTNTDRTHTLAPWLRFYNTGRRYSALGGQPPAIRLS